MLINSICEVNIDGKMALVSLYDDLPHFEYDTTIDNLKDSNNKLKTFVQKLKECNQKLEKELLHIKSINKTLSKNITSLYKTATCEIQRKDKIIEELRQSLICEQSTSKMFSSNKSLPIEKKDNHKVSEENDNTYQINSTVDAKDLNQCDNDIMTNVVLHPNHNVPKTVYYKRLCQKLNSQNKIIMSKNMIPKQLGNRNSNTSNKTIQHTNEEPKNNVLFKEMATPQLNNNHEENLGSTLAVCKSNIVLNDSKFDNTAIIQCESPEKSKENVSLSSFFSKLKSPVKLKKKMVIAPATIGVQNIPNKTLRNIEKLNKSKHIDLETQCIIDNSPQNKLIETLINDTQPTFIEDHKNSVIDSKTNDNVLITTDKLHDHHLSTSVNNNQICPLEVETVPAPFKNEVKIIEMDKSLAVRKLEAPSIHPSECQTPVNKDDCNLTKSNKSSSSIKSCTKNKSYETSLVNKTSINIEVEQIPFRKRTVKVLKDYNTLPSSNIKEFSRVTCINSSANNELNMSAKRIKKLTTSNENELIPSDLKQNQSEHNSPVLNCYSNDPNDKFDEISLAKNTSINIEVEQGFIFRRSNSRKVITHPNFDDDKTETKKGRRVKLITIKDHCSQPSPSFNGAKKKEIDVSKNSIHIEKVVESSSLFYIPQVKRRRTINFSNAES